MTPTTASHDHPDHPALNTVPSEPELAAESTAIDVTSDPIVSPSSPVPAVVLLLQSQLEDLQEKLGEEKDSNGRKQKQIEGLLQTANILQSQKEEELRKQIFQLHGTIGERERDRVRLQNEIDRRTAAIRGCGEEIGRLRSGVKEATEERNDLAERLKRIVESEKKEMGRIMELVKTADPAGPAPPSSLLHQMRILTTRYQQQSSDLREAQQNNDSLDSTINAQEEKIGQYNELQKVMAKQAKQLGKMDKLEGKLGAYKSTVAMQVSRVAHTVCVALSNSHFARRRRLSASWRTPSRLKSGRTRRRAPLRGRSRKFRPAKEQRSWSERWRRRKRGRRSWRIRER